MSGISLPRSAFVAYLSDQLGFKSGLALTLDEIVSHADTSSELYTQLTGRGPDVSLHIDELVASFQLMLHRLGVLPHHTALHAPTWFRLKYQHDTVLAPVVAGIFDLLAGPNDWVLPNSEVELSSYLATVEYRWGDVARELAKEIVDMMYLYRVGSLCEIDRFRRVDWGETIQLRELFASESLDSAYGNFVDQRYIDYLGANFDAVDSMNWRKFEGLTARFFEDAGYDVDMGPGRGDGGIDIRAWKSGAERAGPPTILVQCKRQKSPIEQVIVKALWADVVHEGAESGLIVTTSRVAPGAKRISNARSYPIGFAERESLVRWLKALRTPGSGLSA